MTERAYRQQLARTLRDARSTLGATQGEVAEWADLTGNYLSRLERGLLTPSAYVLAKLVLALKLDPSAVLPAKAPEKRAHAKIARIAMALEGATEQELDLVHRMATGAFTRRS